MKPHKNNGWVPRKLNELGFVARGKSRHRPRNAPELYGGPYPFFQTGDIKAADLYLRNFQQTYSEAGLARVNCGNLERSASRLRRILPRQRSSESLVASRTAWSGLSQTRMNRMSVLSNTTSTHQAEDAESVERHNPGQPQRR